MIRITVLTLLFFAPLPSALSTEHSGLSNPHSALTEPFTVERGIESDRVLTISGRLFPESSTPVTGQFALFSPDGSRFIVRTRRGDIARDVNIDAVLLWKRAELDRVLQSGQSLPKPVQLHAHAFHDDGGGLDRLKWENLRTLSFLALGEEGVVQAFILDTDSKRLTQLTQSMTDVVSFVTSEHQTIYYAREQSAPSTVVNATDLTLYDLYHLDAGSSYAVVLYRQTRGSQKPQPLSAGAYMSAEPKIWISPDERYAVTLAPEVNPPDVWSQYQVRTRGYTDINVQDPKNSENAERLRYILVDLKTGSSEPLLNAPAGILANNGTPLEVFWSKGGKAVIVSNTYLPIPEEEAATPTLQPVIAEISLETGVPITIATEPVAKPGQPLNGRVVGIQYNDAKNELLITRRTGDISNHETYSRNESSWTLASTQAPPSSQADRPRIWLRQNESERPKLYVAMTGSQGRELYDPNPDFDRFSFGRQETFKFHLQGQERTAAVIYPVGYREGQRYPFILQTHGLGRDQYVLEGPKGSTTAYAAQAFANAGFVVAQLPDIRVEGYNTAQEALDNAEYWHTAIETLASRGLIDREKMGVIAWSRTGFHLLGALARYPSLFKAASMSDSVQYGSYLQVLATPARDDRIRSHAENTSGKVFERGLTQWIEDRNVFYASLQSRTPMRIEGMGSPIAMWDTFATRRMQGFPVDYTYYPTGSHNLMKPSERLASQGGSVDWFRFWLQGYEDPAASKAEQYKRWREMRDTR
jgi:dipeptidyl aminopeptidase/acylaminoacyl peptidase